MKANKFFTLLLVALFSVSFVSCSDDDDEDNLIGNWYTIHEQGWEKTDGEIDDEWDNDVNESNSYLSIKDDHTFTHFYNGNADGSGTWSYENGVFTMKDEDDESKANVLKIEKSELVLEFYEKDVYEGVTSEYYEKVTFQKR